MDKMHKRAMLVLLETRMTEHKRLAEEFKFDSPIQSSIVGLSGGIAIMYKEDSLKLDNISITSQGIHLMVKVLSNPHPWFISTIYARCSY